MALFRRSVEEGFTLVELMVALFIFGILSAAGVALLTFSVRAQDAAGERLAEMAELRRLGAIMTGDLAQSVPRITRNALGDPLPAFRANPPGDEPPLLGLVRTGWSNGADASRASLQKVEYQLRDGNLERTAYAMLDGGEALPPAILFRGVEALRLRFRVDNDWRESWDPTRDEEMPDAVDLVLKPRGGAEIRQLFIVGSSY